MKNFNAFLISDNVNGLLEIHADKELAYSALESFISEGNEINKSNGDAARAEDFFSMEEIEVSSMDDLKSIYADHGSKSGVYSLDILAELCERGLISEDELLAAKE